MSRRLLAAVAATVALSACDFGEGGPGTVSGSVEGASELGAVVLEVIGSSVEGFVGQGATRVYDAPLPDHEDLPPYVRRYRVMLVAETPGELRFGVRVTDVEGDLPLVSVVTAVDAGNAPTEASELTVRLVRSPR